jgi:DNA-binding CsgD family transcriptional regulator
MAAPDPLDQMLQVAESTAPLLERARCVVETLDRWLPVDAIWLTLCDPGANAYATIGSTGLERSVLDYLDRPSVAREIREAELDRDRPPISVTELPMAVENLATWAECLIPAGFEDGLGVPLVEPGGAYLGMLGLLFSGSDPLTAEVRAQLARLAPIIARAVSPMRSLLATARLVRGARSGVMMLRDGATHQLPGLTAHPLLVKDSPVTVIARDGLRGGQVYRSFMWPAGDEPTSHVRVTALAANDVPAFVLGTVLLTPTADCRGLTPRELEVLGQLVAGRSNQQIAHRMAITPRTVATHVEHILAKLEVPTRTEAAVLAERDGCYVPARTRPRDGGRGRV